MKPSNSKNSSRESEFCSYHNRKHKHVTGGRVHRGCVAHGHCLFPSSCPKSGGCPAHTGGKNKFLMWDGRRKM